MTEVLGPPAGCQQSSQQVSASASGNLGAVEDGLSSRVQQIEGLLSEIATQTGRASEQVAEQVEALHRIRGAIQQATELARTLDERGRALTAGAGSASATARPKPPTALEHVGRRA